MLRLREREPEKSTSQKRAPGKGPAVDRSAGPREPDRDSPASASAVERSGSRAQEERPITLALLGVPGFWAILGLDGRTAQKGLILTNGGRASTISSEIFSTSH